MRGFEYLKPDLWLEASLHPECPASCQQDQVFPRLVSALEQTLELVPKFCVALHGAHEAHPMVIPKFLPIAALQMLDQISV
jgi:hypothetical protein